MTATNKAPDRRTRPRAVVPALVVAILACAGCGGHGKDNTKSAKKQEGNAGPHVDTIGTTRPEKRDIRLNVVQPGTILAYEVTPIYSRLSGYVDRYRVNIGDRVKTGDILLEMRIPDYVEGVSQKTAAAKRANVQISVNQAILKATEARIETTRAQLTSAEAGVRKSQANYDRWYSESQRIKTLVAQRVIDEQVRDETNKQFEESVASREQAVALVQQATADRDRAIADRDKAKVDIDAAQADLEVARADENLSRVLLEFGTIRAPYDGVITRRNVNPGDYLQPGGGAQMPPLYVLEQTDPVRIFVGVPELSSAHIKDHDVATLAVQALPGQTIEGTVVRSGFSLDPNTRTMQAEIDIPNPHGLLRPGMYVTVSIVVQRKGVFTVPSTAVRFKGQQAYLYLLDGEGKVAMTQVQIGPSDDTHTEVVRRRAPGKTGSEAWMPIDDSQTVLTGSLDALVDGQPIPGKESQPAAKR